MYKNKYKSALALLNPFLMTELRTQAVVLQRNDHGTNTSHHADKLRDHEAAGKRTKQWYLIFLHMINHNPSQPDIYSPQKNAWKIHSIHIHIQPDIPMSKKSHAILIVSPCTQTNTHDSPWPESNFASVVEPWPSWLLHENGSYAPSAPERWETWHLLSKPTNLTWLAGKSPLFKISDTSSFKGSHFSSQLC